MTEQQLPHHTKDWQGLPRMDALSDHDDDDDIDSACALRQDTSLCFIKDHINLHSSLYHQHILTSNRFLLSSPKRNANKMSESSSSKSKQKPKSAGIGAITVVTKTTTTTTITGFPVVDVSSRRGKIMAQHVAQQAASPNNSSSDTSSSSSDEDEENRDDMLSMDSMFAATLSFPSPKRQNHTSACAYQRHEASTTTHPQAASQSTATPEILKSKSTKKTPMAKSKRTTTSYDAETTAYLKRAFFNYYSKQCKLTREQREAVIRETGLHSRKITYWFSNHKRRLGTELAIYRKLTREHKIKDYDAFVQWRQDQKLPAYITREEISSFKASR
ncbi:hypothetical protein MAM1_0354d09972 [Mucor ambiguus]|uniref:Homeobox domain-containing protein n=1 Tax=Mucor ambiguus TaxID=91626 RepID=A0A0C9MI08_9FUNG|nr:hypothetical protein MAM1_0354d09972 [Mucor ambiguus]